MPADCGPNRGEARFEDRSLYLEVGKIRAAGAGHQLLPLADAIEDLNEYTRAYHHGEGPNPATEPISETELQGKVETTLELTGGS